MLVLSGMENEPVTLIEMAELTVPPPLAQLAALRTPVSVFFFVWPIIIGLVGRYCFKRWRKNHPKQPRPNQHPMAAFPLDASIRPKSRVGYVLFAIFFGALGIHNFYALRIKSAVAQFLLTLFSGIALGGITGIAFATKWEWWMANGWLVAAIVEPVVVLGVWLWGIVEICLVSRDGRGVPLQ